MNSKRKPRREQVFGVFYSVTVRVANAPGWLPFHKVLKKQSSSKTIGLLLLLSYLNSNSSSIVRKSILFMFATVSSSKVESFAGMVSSDICVSSFGVIFSMRVSCEYMLLVWLAGGMCIDVNCIAEKILS